MFAPMIGPTASRSRCSVGHVVDEVQGMELEGDLLDAGGRGFRGEVLPQVDRRGPLALE